VAVRTRVGPARMPSRESPESAIESLLARGYDACEIDFESGFWMDYPFAERLGALARENDVALSVHAPLFGFMGHVEPSGRKFTSAVGALDRSAGIAAAAGAEVAGLNRRVPATRDRRVQEKHGEHARDRQRDHEPRRTRVPGHGGSLAPKRLDAL
jgi:endonuclease IV